MDSYGVLIFVAVLAAVVVGVVAAHRFEKRRREGLATWGGAEGWAWRPMKDRRPSHPFALFQQGHTRYSQYHLSRTIDGATPGLGDGGFALFEYHYAITTGHGKDRRTHHYWHRCALIEQQADLGQVKIRDEHWGDKLVQAIGFDDIDFEDPDFSRQFVVQAKNRRDAYDLIGPGMMSYLVNHKGWRIETLGPLALVYTQGRLTSEWCGQAVEFAQGFLAQLPRIKVNEARARLGLPPLVEAGAAATASRQEAYRRGS